VKSHKMNEEIRCLMVGDGSCEMEDLIKNHLKGRHTTPLLIEKVLSKQPLVLPIDRHNLEIDLVHLENGKAPYKTEIQLSMYHVVFLCFRDTITLHAVLQFHRKHTLITPDTRVPFILVGIHHLTEQFNLRLHTLSESAADKRGLHLVLCPLEIYSAIEDLFTLAIKKSSMYKKSRWVLKRWDSLNSLTVSPTPNLFRRISSNSKKYLIDPVKSRHSQFFIDLNTCQQLNTIASHSTEHPVYTASSTHSAPYPASSTPYPASSTACSDGISDVSSEQSSTGSARPILARKYSFVSQV